MQKVNFIKNTKLTVYPNPTKDIIKISLSVSMRNEPANICLFSIDGRLLSKKRITALGQTETIDLSRYPEGKYILKIDADNELKSKKVEVVKQK